MLESMKKIPASVKRDLEAQGWGQASEKLQELFEEEWDAVSVAKGFAAFDTHSRNGDFALLVEREAPNIAIMAAGRPVVWFADVHEEWHDVQVAFGTEEEITAAIMAAKT